MANDDAFADVAIKSFPVFSARVVTSYGLTLPSHKKMYDGFMKPRKISFICSDNITFVVAA